MTFSSYKGAVTFVSDLWGGCVSDHLITERSEILALLQRGNNVMSDRGFDIQDVLTPLDVTLNIPSLLDQRSRLSELEFTETRRWITNVPMCLD